ncbi:MAG: prenyltransferase, partial [Chloroflexi bacterium]|nr:prenyltransferase [Chloroflexota bacterium]
GLLLLPLLIVAGVCVLLYTPFILKLKVPEWAAGLGLGTLPILGAYFVQTTFYTTEAVIASIPSGILVHNLLLLNEFPDVDADKKGGRKTMPIVWGKKKAGLVYSLLTLLVYFWVIGGVAAGKMPIFSLLSWLTIPLAARAIRDARKAEEPVYLMPAMKNNVLVILLTQLLMGIGYVLAGISR